MVDFENAPPAIDRRSLLRARAWAAPVLVLATAAPAAWASVAPTGKLHFNNLSYHWVYGTGRVVVGVQANASVQFHLGDRYDPVDLARSRHRNMDNQYSSAVPRYSFRQPEWAAAGVAKQ